MVSMNYFERFILTFLFLGTALFVNPLLNTDVFEFPKLMVLLIGVSVWTIFNIFVNGEFFLRKWPKAFLFLVLFFLSSVGAFLLSEDRSVALIGEDMRFQGFLTQFHYVLLALNCFVFFRKYGVGKTAKVFDWINITLLLVCFFALVPFVSSWFLIFDPRLFFGRLFGTFGNPNYLAAFLIAALPFYILFWSGKKKLWVNLVYFVGLILVVSILFFTGTRSAWIACLGAFGFLGVLRFVKFRQIKLIGIVLSFIFLIGSAVFLQTNFGHRESETLDRLSLKSQSVQSLDTRIDLWKAGVAMFWQRPWFGYGQDSIQNHIDPYLPEYLEDNEVFYVDRTHSEFIDVLVTLGVFGFIGYLGFLLSAFLVGVRNYLRMDFDRRNLFEAILVSFVALNLFHAVNFATTTSNVLLYLLAVWLLSVRQK